MIRFEVNKQAAGINLEPELKKLSAIIFKEFKKNGIISIAFISSGEIRQLNKTYRKKDKTTDILTFVLGDSGYLGEILLSYKDIKIRAKICDKSILETAVFLIIHGVCHIFGYTHKRKNDTLKMEAKEKKILKRL
jgi:probable rRNA maturation factor